MTKRWNRNTSKDDENQEVDLFLDEVLAVCAEYGMSIAHEDEHGAFIVVPSEPVWDDSLRTAFMEDITKPSRTIADEKTR